MSKITIIFNKPLIYTLVIYFLVNVLMVFNNGVLYDDWVLYDKSSKSIIDAYTCEGWYYTGIWAIQIFQFSFSNPIIVSHIFTIILGSIIIIFFYNILKSTALDLNLAALITLIFALSPFNIVRFLGMNLPYTLCLCFFLISYWLLIFNHGKNKLAYNIITGLLLFYSFVTNSILILYPIILLHLFILTQYNIKLFLKKYYWLFLLPAIFLTIRFTVLLPLPDGPDVNYNKIKPYHLKEIPGDLLDLNIGYLKYMVQQMKSFTGLFLGIFILSLMILITGKSDFLKSKVSPLQKILVITVGIILFALAVTPYILVGKHPEFKGWETRHQLLIPFGYSMVMAGIIILVNNFYFRAIALSIIVTLFITATVSQMVDKYRVWFKNEAVYMYFKSNNPGSPNTFIVNDDSKCTDATDIKLGWYALSAIYKQATGKEDKFFVSVQLLGLNRTELQEHVDKRKAVNLSETYNLSSFDQIREIGKFNIVCKRQLTVPELFRFVSHYYNDRHKELEGMYLSCYTISTDSNLR